MAGGGRPLWKAARWFLGGFLTALVLFSRILVIWDMDNLEASQKIETMTLPKVSEQKGRPVRVTDHRGSWLGRTWIPPPEYRLYSANQLRKIYRGKRVLFMGDSTMRRAFYQFKEILTSNVTKEIFFLDETKLEEDNSNRKIPVVNSSFISGLLATNTTNEYDSDIDWRTLQSSELIDKAKIHGVGEEQHTIKNCKRWNRIYEEDPHNNTFSELYCSRDESINLMDYHCSRCLRDFANILTVYDIGSHYDLIVVGGGAWDLKLSPGCNKVELHPRITEGSILNYPHKYNKHYGVFEIMLKTLVEKYPRLKVLWRTGPYMDEGVNREQTQLELDGRVRRWFNNLHPKGSTDRRIDYLDFGAAMTVRAYGVERLKGNSPVHWDSIARNVFLQLLTNKVLEMDGWP